MIINLYFYLFISTQCVFVNAAIQRRSGRMPSPDWFTKAAVWTGNEKSILLSKENPTDPIPTIELEEIVEKSKNFPIRFPIVTVCCSQLKRKSSKAVLEKNINSSYPVIHEHALHLCATFLAYQKEFGNTAFYKDMSLIQLIDRLLSKRAVSFVGANDSWILLDKNRGTGGWEAIGTANEQPPLILENCLSYDEIKLSALLSVSSHTYFINDGNRHNQGIPEVNLDEIEQTGVIIGLIGTRLEKEKVMEYREIVKSMTQNTHEYGYGKENENSPPTLQQKFLEFYGDTNATYQEIVDELESNRERYSRIGYGIFFDRLMYERRISLSIDTLMIEANDRAKKENTKAFVHVIGIGLGVWRISGEQNKLFGDACAKRLEVLKDQLTNVSDVCFAYIRQKRIGGYKNGDKIGDITVHINDRDPHDRLKGVHAGKLLVVSYAWDGNALPGNEFWYGSLDGSGDPAAACSTQVAELHNYHINGKVRGSNLRVATMEHGLVTFQEYQKLHKDD